MSMRSALLAAAAIVLLALPVPVSASEKVLYRIFLQDGTALVSYGEYARLEDRVVFSIPVGAVEPSPQLQLVSIADSAVDWRRTEEYAEAVRARRYAETRGEEDFAILSNRVAAALNEVAHTKDPVRRLAMAHEARANLAEWPKRNYGYRAADVTQLLWLFDDVIAQLRAAAGQASFDLSLYATTAPPPPGELLPEPDARAMFEQAMTAARVATDPAERVSLLRAVEKALSPAAVNGDWEAEIKARAAAELALELRITGLYADLRNRTVGPAERHARRADVRGLEALIQNVRDEDARLGRVRPQETAALLAELDMHLDAARRLRLARDSWAFRGAMLRDYRSTLEPAIAQFHLSKKWLEDIRALAGPAPASLTFLMRRMTSALRALAKPSPPSELAAARELLVATAKIAIRAAQARRNAVESNDMAIAWEASSAAAGALMMLDRALDDINRLTSPPRPR
jgi:hypothetical protein